MKFNERWALLLLSLQLAAVMMTADTLTGLGMGLTIAAVWLVTALLCALIRPFARGDWRLCLYAVAAVAVASAAGLCLRAFFPALYKAGGALLAVTALDAVVFQRPYDREKTGLGRILGETLLLGVCAAVLLGLVGFFREALGAGTLLGSRVELLYDNRLPILTRPAGGLLVFALTAALVGAVLFGRKKEG